MVRKTFIALLFLLVLGAGTAYGVAREVNLDAGNNKDCIRIEKGNVIVITLEANASTGYTWDVAAVKERVLRYKGKDYVQSSQAETPTVGAPGKEVLRFKAIGQGISSLRLVYHQPWDKKAKAAQIFTVKVTVR